MRARCTVLLYSLRTSPGDWWYPHLEYVVTFLFNNAIYILVRSSAYFIRILIYLETCFVWNYVVQAEYKKKIFETLLYVRSKVIVSTISSNGSFK